MTEYHLVWLPTCPCGKAATMSVHDNRGEVYASALCRKDGTAKMILLDRAYVGVKQFHTRLLPRCECGKPAQVVIRNHRNAPVGDVLCERCGHRKLAATKRQELRQLGKGKR